MIGKTSWIGVTWCAVVISAAVVPHMLGCRSGRSPKNQPEPPIVRKVDFEGISRFKRTELLEYLQVKANSPWSKLGLADTSYLVKGRLRADKQRLVELYRSAGYYDAKVLAVRAEPDRIRTSRVRIIFEIEEGMPILVESVLFQFKATVPGESNIIKSATLKRGSPADVSLLNESKTSILEYLHDKGYIFAHVTETMTVDVLRRRATAGFVIDPGPRPSIGRIHLSGLEQVPEDLVQREIADFIGKRFTPRHKEELENKLLGMNVFNVASATKRDTLDDSGRLVIDVLLVESNPQRLKLGIGLGVEPDKNVVTTSSLYSHRNLFGRLVGFEMRSTAGYAVMPDFFHADQHGPVLLLEPSLTKKGLLEQELLWVFKTAMEADIEADYKYFGPTAQFSVSRFFFEKTLASLGYHFESYFFYQSEARWEETLAALYPELESPFLHGFIELRYRIMLTDKIVNPKNGMVLELKYAFSHKALGSDTRYHRFSPTVRAYWQIFSRLQLATRLSTGFVYPFGGTDLTMQWSNFHLGGYNTVRGWGGKRLAPSISFCSDDRRCETVRIGGRTMVLGNLELRLRTIKNVYVVAFLDAGDVQYDVYTFIPKRWNYSVGGGMRIKTGVGKLRFDIGYRVNTPPPYQEEPRWGIHIGLGESF